MPLYDCLVIGAGPAGLSAALMLARYGRRTLTFHNNRPRNAPTRSIHGFLGHDGISPADLFQRGRAEVERYGGRIVEATVEAIERKGDAFLVRAGNEYSSRCVLLATGLRDITPECPGFLDFYGTSIHHCPDCDGYEVRQRRVVVLSKGHEAVALLKELRVWTSQLTLLTDGDIEEFDRDDQQWLKACGIPVRTTRLAAMEGDVASRNIQQVRLVDGSVVPCDALFFHLGTVPASNLHDSLGCATEGHLIRVSPDQETTVPGVYAAGDITPVSQLAIVAAAEGCNAALHIHKALLAKET